MDLHFRDATAGDAPALAAIYRPIVLETSISFELEPPDAEEFARRIEVAQSRWAYLVAEDDDGVVAYAYGGALRTRAAYAWSVETSIYVHARARRTGVARRLYPVLFERLAARGYRNAYAGTTLPNDPSVALHRAVGFEPIGTYPRVGFKFGNWHDVAWLHRPLGDGDPLAPPQQPPL